MMNRPDAIARLRSGETWDVLLIGGGATGLYAALDAASRGYRTLLLERGDFASGTSSRSTKLIHGGVRYLRQGRPGLVRSALRERTRLLANAPSLVHVRNFVVPVRSLWEKNYYGAGLKLYDLLARGHQTGPSRILSAAETRDALPTLRPDRFTGGVRYTDGQFDDAALAVALAATVAQAGATVLNYVAATALLKAGGRVAGAVAQDVETGETFEIRARVVINATGVFADEVRRLDEARAAPLLAPSQGAHVVLPRGFLPGETALMIPKTDDGRLLFVIPWLGRVLLGTTDTVVTEISREPLPLAAEVDFLLAHAARYLTRAPTRADVLSTFAGLRPLGKGSGPTSALSRDHLITVSAAGLVTITGGKWTTARRMAEDVVNRAALLGNLPARSCGTATLPVSSPWRGDPGSVDDAFVASAARETMARTIEDVLARRSRLLHLDARAASAAAPRVAAVLAETLGRDGAWQEKQVQAFRTLAGRHLP